ncbi:hypothetical protein GCM10010218_38170 [Streptomyces mashuensis]|uniref:Uncharacterized protein n=1 Tax=Streptomyces mashuensis TaxID=33904 RepID=A0A919EE04_9ACTN|nr:hypothetical protein [Streptomyces mashuensis]GHF53094.1 hypothetical protein GCM10010218_38170 [Streptomyces mashuensis]
MPEHAAFEPPLTFVPWNEEAAEAALAAGEGRRLRGSAAHGSPAHRWMLSRDFRQVNRYRTLRLPREPIPVAGRGCSMEWHERTADAPDDVLQAWLDFQDARGRRLHVVEKETVEGLRARCSSWYSPFAVARRDGGTVAGVALLDDVLCGDDLEVDGGPVDPADPEGDTLVAALLSLCYAKLPSCTFYMELGDEDGERVRAFVESVATAVDFDNVICERPGPRS